MAKQRELPIFHDGVNQITGEVGYEKKDDTVVYFCGVLPVYSHHKDDYSAFRTIVCQLYLNGNSSQADLIRAFGLAPVTVKRWVKKYRADGPGAFFKPRKTRGKATVLTPPVLQKAQNLLDTHHDVREVAKELEISYDVVRKAVADGRLTKPPTPKKTTMATMATA